MNRLAATIRATLALIVCLGTATIPPLRAQARAEGLSNADLSESALWPDPVWLTRLTLQPALIQSGESIGITPRPVDYGMIVPGDPSDDFLVIDESGRPLPIRAEHYLQSRLASGSDNRAQGQTLIRFRTSGESFPVRLFFGHANPSHPPRLTSLKTLTSATTGLMLETSQIDARQFRVVAGPNGARDITGFPTQLADYQRLRRRVRNVYGNRARARPTIDDIENPYGTHDLYLSRYEGWQYCFAPGAMRFYLKADDGALVFFGSAAEPLAVREPTVRPDLWADAATNTVSLDRPTLLPINAYHIEIDGDTQGLPLGWQTPGMIATSIIPPPLWLDYLPCRDQDHFRQQ